MHYETFDTQRKNTRKAFNLDVFKRLIKHLARISRVSIIFAI